MSRSRLTQVQLFAVIYEELATQLGDRWPTIDLLRAADRLSKLIEVDFNLARLDRIVDRSNYFSHDLTWAFSQRIWQIACRERNSDLLGDQRLAADVRAQTILREYLDSW